MKLPKVNIPSAYLKQEEMIFAKSPMVISTVLGSCVAVTMYNARYQVGAICHALLPAWKKCIKGQPKELKYVDSSVQFMLHKFQNVGISIQEIDVKVFGGAYGLSKVINQGIAINVGKENADMAMTVIKSAGLRIVSSSVGGNDGRKLFFYSHTGEVYMKYLRKD